MTRNARALVIALDVLFVDDDSLICNDR